MDGLTLATAVTVGGLVVAMVAVVSAQVFFRYVVGASLSWAEEIARFFMIWMAFLGSALAVRYGGHIAIDAAVTPLPATARHVLRLLVYALLVVLLVVLAQEAWALNQRVWRQRSPALRISVGWVYLAAPVGFGLMALNFTHLLIEALLGRDATKVLYDQEE
jgi:TRAP-type transport system small permease protein